MIDALRYELTRLFTLRSTWWLTGIALALGAVLGLPALSIHGPAKLNDYGDLMTGGGIGVLLVSVMPGLIGVFALGHDYRYGTIRPTLTALPRRTLLMGVKVGVILVYAFVLATLTEIIRYAVGYAILGGRLTHLGLFAGPMGRVWIGVIVYVTIYALVGLAFAGLFRSVPGAIVTLIVFPLVAETVIKGLLSIPVFKSIRPAAKALPFSAGQQFFRFTTDRLSDAPGGFREVPSPGAGLTIFLVFLVIVLGLSWLLFERRDA